MPQGIVPVNFRDRGIVDGIAESLIWNGISSVKRKMPFLLKAPYLSFASPPDKNQSYS